MKKKTDWSEKTKREIAELMANELGKAKKTEFKKEKSWKEMSGFEKTKAQAAELMAAEQERVLSLRGTKTGNPFIDEIIEQEAALFDKIKQVSDNEWEQMSGFEKTKTEVADLMTLESDRTLKLKDKDKRSGFVKKILEQEFSALQESKPEFFEKKQKEIEMKIVFKLLEAQRKAKLKQREQQLLEQEVQETYSKFEREQTESKFLRLFGPSETPARVEKKKLYVVRPGNVMAGELLDSERKIIKLKDRYQKENIERKIGLEVSKLQSAMTEARATHQQTEFYTIGVFYN